MMRQSIFGMSFRILASSTLYLWFSLSAFPQSQDDTQWALLIKELPERKAQERLLEIITSNSDAAVERKNWERTKQLLALQTKLSKPLQKTLYTAAARLEFKYGEAKKALLYATRFRDSDTGIPILIASCYIKLNELEKARGTIEEALRQPKRFSATQQAYLYFLTGQAYVGSNRKEDAILQFKKSLLTEFSEGALSALFSTLREVQRSNEALRLLDYWSTAQGHLASSVFLEGGHLASNLHQQAAASRNFKRAWKTGSKEAGLYYLVELPHGEGKSEFEHIVMDEIMHQRQNSSFFVKAGLISFKHNWVKIGRRCFEEVRTASDSDLYLMAEIEARERLLVSAENHLRQLQKQNAKYPGGLFLLSEVLMRKGDFNSAIDVLNPALKDPLTSEKALATQARILIAQGDQKAWLLISTLQKAYPKKGYSMEMLVAGLSGKFIANLEVMNRLKAGLVKHLLTNAQTELRITVDKGRRAELFFTIARCELLVGNGENCLTCVNEAIALGKDGYASLNLRAAAFDLMLKSTDAEQERDAIVETFRRLRRDPIQPREHLSSSTERPSK